MFLFIELRQIADQEGLLWQRVKAVPDSIRALFGLQPKAIAVTTAKDTKSKLAIIGAMVIENNIESLTSHFANQKTSPQDGNLSAVLVAPSSIMDYLSFLATALSPMPRVSKAIGFIKTAQMALESAVEMDYQIDGQRRKAKQLAFRILPKAITVNVGQDFVEAHQPVFGEKRQGHCKNTDLTSRRGTLATPEKKPAPVFNCSG